MNEKIAILLFLASLGFLASALILDENREAYLQQVEQAND